MMNAKRKLVLLSVALGLLSAALLWKYASDLKAELGYGQMVELVFARVPVPEGAVMSRDHVQVRQVPQAFSHPSSVRAQRMELVLGRRTAAPLAAGQPILLSDLAGGQAGPERLSSLLEVGERALTIPVDPRLALGGLVEPGDRVDILLSWIRPDRSRTTQTILQGILVSAVGARYTEQAEAAGKGRKESNVTVRVTPQQAELLVHALDRGTIALSLRARGDVEPVKFEAQDFNHLLGEEAPVTGDDGQAAALQRKIDYLLGSGGR